MRVLVTGGAGFIGSHTVDSLLARGHQVRILDSLEPPVHTRERPAYLPPEVELLNGSVTERTALRRALEGIDAVIHLAAYQDYLTDFSRFFHVNTVSTALLYELVVNDQLPVQKIVLASTQAVYGEGKYHCPAHGVVYPGQRFSAQLERGDWDHHCETCGALLEPCWTDEPVVRPHNSYAMSKRAQEELALALAHRYSIPTVALRYSIVQGPRQSFRNPYSGALRSFTVRILAGRSPIVYEDGEQLRDYVSIHDVVRANLLVLEDPRANYQVFNVGGGRQVTVRELAAMVLEEAGSSLAPSVPGLFRVGDTRHVFSDISRLESLGWQPLVSQRTMVREYLDWAVTQPDIHDTVTPAQAQMEALGVLRPLAESRA